jgi:nitrate/TMAO reductase-like tetraheme cytochrome c subunit
MVAGIRNVLSRIISKRPIAGLFATVVAGMALWGGFNWSLEVTNTESFCLLCHEMAVFVYPEYKASSHYANRTGVRASCRASGPQRFVTWIDAHSSVSAPTRRQRSRPSW